MSKMKQGSVTTTTPIKLTATKSGFNIESGTHYIHFPQDFLEHFSSPNDFLMKIHDFSESVYKAGWSDASDFIMNKKEK
jgi:hypothetical protein